MRLVILIFSLFVVTSWAEELSLADLEQHTERWPKEVTVKVPLQLKLFSRGQEVGSMALPTGRTAKPVSLKNGQLTVEVMGARAEVAVTDTDFVERVGATAAPSVAPTPTPAVAASTRTETSAPAAVTPTGGQEFQKINAALGVPLFQDENLWDDDAAAVAKRLQWPEESRTETQGSYRLYAKADVRVLGARPYSLAMYEQLGKPDRFSMVFANKGDFEGLGKLEAESNRRESSKELREREKENKKVIKGFSDAVKSDAETIEAALTQVLGEPQRMQFGLTGSMRETVNRWDWKGHAFLLASPKGEYTAVRILPVELADEKGRTAKISDADLRELLLKRVLHRDNGDVLVQQIPMVDQGPKGFCVPATWERYLRYLEMPADMYVLAMAGGTAMGGGTSTYMIRSQVESYVRQYERQIQVVDPSIETKNLAKYIDKGLPLMWACFVIEPIEKEFSKRTKERRTVTDWAAYEKSLESVRTAMKGKNFVDTAAGHVRMIIGYNPKTREVAISDSWGLWAVERWLTYEEAAAISQGELTLIRW